MNTPAERFAFWWCRLRFNEKRALCMLAEVPIDRAELSGFFEFCADEQHKMLHALKGGGVLCQLVIEGFL